jgi:hypothetical protein
MATTPYRNQRSPSFRRTTRPETAQYDNLQNRRAWPIMQNERRRFDEYRNCGGAQSEKKGRRKKKPSSCSKNISEVLKK